MFTLIASILGIVSTILAWTLNPKRRLYAELDDIYKNLERLYGERDEALVKNDSDKLTIITSDIIRLCSRKTILLQRLGAN